MVKMVSLNILFLFLVFNVNNLYVQVVSSEYVQSRNYYWRDYSGIIPRDAVEGGKVNGTMTYIGQVLLPNESSILPGFINPLYKRIVVAYNGTSEYVNNIKVLCSKNVKLLTWITNKNFPASSSDLVYGGVVSNTRVYIGRTVYGYDNIVGKVFNGNDSFEGLYIPHDKGEVFIQSYQVLAHRPPQPDYYWRNYDGYIPDDAVEGGVMSRESIYVAQTLLPSMYGIYPGIIFPGNTSALTVYSSRAYLSSARVKILCSRHLEKFKWITSSTSDFPKVEKLVVGGQNTDELFYIGRIKDNDDDDVIGRVSTIRGCFVPTKANRYYLHTSFEVLAYDA